MALGGWQRRERNSELQQDHRVISAQFKDHQHYLRHSVMALNKKGERGREKI